MAMKEQYYTIDGQMIGYKTAAGRKDFLTDALGSVTAEVDQTGATKTFDCLYPALGSDSQSELAAQVGAELSNEGCLVVDAHQRTKVPGLYAAGDVVLGLDQISHAMGEGGVAATTIRNDLAQRTRLFR